MIGSHNTFSYLKPKHWWHYFLTPWHKCQDLDVVTQIFTGSVKYIDIRIRFINGLPVFVHNNVIYKSKYSVKTVLKDLSEKVSYYKAKPIYCRLILDIRKKPKDADNQIKLFNDFIKWFPNDLIIDEARIFWDWENPLIKSKYTITEIHTSVCSPWYEYVLGTKWFAKKHNKEVYKMSNLNNIYLIDYVWK